MDSFYILLISTPVAVLCGLAYYTISCWQKHIRGGKLKGEITVIDALCFLSVCLIIVAGAEDAVFIMTVLGAGTAVLGLLRMIDMITYRFAVKKLARAALAAGR